MWNQICEASPKKWRQWTRASTFTSHSHYTLATINRLPRNSNLFTDIYTPSLYFHFFNILQSYPTSYTLRTPVTLSHKIQTYVQYVRNERNQVPCNQLYDNCTHARMYVHNDIKLLLYSTTVQSTQHGEKNSTSMTTPLYASLFAHTWKQR